MRTASILIIAGFIALPSVVRSSTPVLPANTRFPAQVYQKIGSLKIREVQKLIGRRLTLKEKISFLALKHTSKKQEQRSKGSTALGFGIAALAILLMGLFVPFVIWLSLPAAILAIIIGSKAKKLDPSDKKAHTAVTLGWVAIGIFVLIGIAVIIVLSSS